MLYCDNLMTNMFPRNEKPFQTQCNYKTAVMWWIIFRGNIKNSKNNYRVCYGLIKDYLSEDSCA